MGALAHEKAPPVRNHRRGQDHRRGSSHGQVPAYRADDSEGRRASGDQGTDVYDHYMRLNQAPSYALAAAIDYQRCKAGQRSVFTWDEK